MIDGKAAFLLLMYIEGCQGDVEKMIALKLARQVERIKAGNGQEVSG